MQYVCSFSSICKVRCAIPEKSKHKKVPKRYTGRPYEQNLLLICEPEIRKERRTQNITSDLTHPILSECCVVIAS